MVCSNGLGWSPDDRTFYFGERFRYTIFAYDFDPDSGALSARRLFATIDPSSGAFPDGLTVDAEGGASQLGSHQAALDSFTMTAGTNRPPR